MINEEKENVRIYVINSNTGHIVRGETISTNETLTEIVMRYATKDYIVVASISNVFYCFYINGEVYFYNITFSTELIDFFNDVLSGLYDNARDSFHIRYGIAVALNKTKSIKYDVILNCIDNIWETRYYSRYLRRGKHD